MEPYTRRGFKVLRTTEDSVVLSRPPIPAPLWILIPLFFLIGIFVLLSMPIRHARGSNRTFEVQLSVMPDGRVQETGDTLDVLQHVTMEGNRKIMIWFGGFILGFGSFSTIVIVAAAIFGAANAVGGQGQDNPLVSGLTLISCFSVPLLALGGFLLYYAAKADR